MSFLGGGNLGPAPNIGPAPQIKFAPDNFTSSGLSSTFNNGYNLSQSPALSGAIGGLQSTFGQQAGALGALRQTVAPGFSQFRQAGLRDLGNQQRATTSNLRDNLAQRRILGSSFAQDTITRSNAEFEKQRTDFIAQSYLQEVSTSQQLIQQQYEAASKSYSVGINQMNFETGLAAQLTSQATAASASVAEAQAKLDQNQAISQAQLTQKQMEMQQQSDAANSAGIGKLIGTGLSLGLAPFTGGASLAGLPLIWGGGGARGGGFGGGGGGFFGGGQPTPNAADFGAGGVGTGGYNFMDAQV